MKKKILISITIIFLAFTPGRHAHAALPTFDAVNAALSEIRNAILNSGFIRELELAYQRLEQLKATYMEMIRFHSGLDEILDSVIGDPIKKIFSFRANTGGRNTLLPKLDLLDRAREPHEIRRILEEITGKLPDSTERPYIAFEESEVIDGLHTAREIREAGNQTREASQMIIEQAKSASPKGAARLSAQALGSLMVLSQQNQEALAKLIELESVQIEQVSREEKRLETRRLEYMREMNQAIETIGRID